MDQIGMTEREKIDCCSRTSMMIEKYVYAQNWIQVSRSLDIHYRRLPMREENDVGAPSVPFYTCNHDEIDQAIDNDIIALSSSHLISSTMIRVHIDRQSSFVYTGTST